MSESDRAMDFEAFVLETSAVFSRVARAEAGDLHSAEDAVQVAYLRSRNPSPASPTHTVRQR
ncbi:hypothetical protein [Streptomyces sp. NPDC051364]|uniref:hypothetical protein n=1 Tax=Streptomyces sp. NPDC051364 TaxID=3155799 RepID=UPI003447B4BB